VQTEVENLSPEDARRRVDEYLQGQSELDLLRFITCGSVDDGKSTLIGRMLYEARLVFDDQVTALKNDSKWQGNQSGDIDFALLVDGLAAEREQGITIDVAYRFFGTEHRKFIVADTPGHDQYTRNMVTGASTADVAVILIDASQGILTQTRRHSFLTSLLGIPHVVLAINKMDLVDYDEETFHKITEQYNDFAKQLTFKSITPIAVSALKGDNVIQRSTQMPWYQGPTLLGFLETVEVGRLNIEHGFRFPVQWVNRPNAEFRGFSGAVAAGNIAKGDAVKIMPSGQEAAVEDIVLFKDSLDHALPGQSVTLTLDREVDVSRGDVIVAANDVCEVSDQFDTSLVWMEADNGYVGRSYWLMLGTTRINATLTEIRYKYNVNSLEQLPARSLGLNDIGRVSISVDLPIPYDSYIQCAIMGSFILMDRYSHATVAAGMINFGLRRAQNLYPQDHSVNTLVRSQLMGHEGKVFWLTGLSGSGKSTVANAFEKALQSQGVHSYILDGDNIRTGLNKDLGFTEADRTENIRRVAEVAKLMKDAGLVVIVAVISPFRSERDMARSLFDDDEFFEVFVDVSLETAEGRDPKGLYRKARQGKLPHFTGIDSPYEAPETAELILDTDALSVEQCVDKLMALT
jgi:bifunctional enzyme CysN/CysC